MAVQGFMRPVTIDDTNDTMTVTIGIVGPTAVVIPHGVYPCWLPVLEWMRQTFIAAPWDADFVIGFLSDHRIAMAEQADGNITIVWTTPLLGQQLGWYGNLAPGSIHVADDVPALAWFPPYQSHNQERFAVDQGAAWAGTEAKDGDLSGTSTGPDVYRRPFTFQHVAANRALASATRRRVPADSWDADRCFETLCVESRTASSPVAGQQHPKGLYYFPTMAPYQFASDMPMVDPQPALPGVMGSGGVCFEESLVATPDRFVYGMPGVAGARPIQADVPRAREYYECGFDFHTAPARAWTPV